MRTYHNGLLSFNSFLSTTNDRVLASARVDSARDDCELTGVFFEIEINSSLSNVPFASLNDVSYYLNLEKEILFSMHTIFRIGEMKQIEYRLWEVKLTLTNDDDELLKSLTDYFREEIKGNSEWIELAHLMFKMGEINKAEEVCKIISNITSNNVLEKDVRFHIQFRMILNEKGNEQEALSYYEKALQIQQEFLPSHHPDLATTHNHIGSVYESMGDSPNALVYYKKAFEIIRQCLPSNHVLRGSAHNNIGKIYEVMEHMGSTYENLGRYDDAVEHVSTAIDIGIVIFEPNHPILRNSQQYLRKLMFSYR
ncbi:unnamed protein product [Adineta steineri]|uniref:Kinesin light chain n=2 Tax=Adineta steineri TaxID=433720 RepID=A0A818ZBA2_9BILA|nr:unnamed protein product [Adineta steineri]